ncbi:hypothetical protein Pelo_18038 [Pelomyxa schiedti]|nr:hypothetical protein Pelo_18038 [Pelomyxa schiedti]
MEPYDHPSTGKWNYIRDLSPALIGTEVEAFAQYGPEKHSLFKCVVPSLTAEHVAIDNHQQVLFSLRLSNWFGRYPVLLNEVDVVLVSSSENVQKVSYLHSLEWDIVCIVTSVPAGAYSVVISTKDDGEIISQFPVDVVPKEPPPTYTWSRLGTSTCHICHDTIRTGSQWTCKACEYDLCDKCHTEATFTTTKHPQHQQHQQEQQHPHPLIRHRFKTKHTRVCCVCGVVLGVGDHCLLPYHRQQHRYTA